VPRLLGDFLRLVSVESHSQLGSSLLDLSADIVPEEKDMKSPRVDRLVRRFGWDEPSLAQGRYITQGDHDALLQRAMSHDFSAVARKELRLLRWRGLTSFLQGLAFR
jgi:hypothetical protein